MAILLYFIHKYAHEKVSDCFISFLDIFLLSTNGQPPIPGRSMAFCPRPKRQGINRTMVH